MALIDDFLPALAFAALLASEPNLAETPYETARSDMDRLLDQASANARRASPAQAENALFAVCAFADEVILASSWSGRMDWMRDKLQQARFHTANAGEEFYERMAGLYGPVPQGQLDMSVFENLDRQPGADQREVLEVFVACLTLGFRGKYHHQQAKAQIEELTKSNLARLHPDNLSLQDKVFPEAYADTRLSRKTSSLSPAFRAFLLFGSSALIAAGVYVSYAALLSTFVSNWLQSLG